MTRRTTELREVAQRLADALPSEVEEVGLTGSVSRGVADAVSDIEMLLVTSRNLELDECFAIARAAGVERLDTWGAQGETKRVSGFVEDVPLELIWWARGHAEASVKALLAGELSSSADAIVHAVPMRTAGALARWRELLAEVPQAVAEAWIEDSALTWSGYAPEGILTLARPGETLSRLERMLDDALRVLRIVYALNRVWPPTTKRLALRLDALRVIPDRLADRIEHALTEQDPRLALLILSEVQAETLALAPDGPNVERART